MSRSYLSAALCAAALLCAALPAAAAPTPEIRNISSLPWEEGSGKPPIMLQFRQSPSPLAEFVAE